MATRLGIYDAARAVATDSGTLINVLNWLPKIPMRLAYSVFFYPWAAIILLKIAGSRKTLIV